MDMKLERIISIWMMVLMISLPFYTANVFAVTVQVTKNTGSEGVDGYIDANGDTWDVEATITGDAEISSENVMMSVGSLQEPFDSCSGDVSGTVCSYSSELTNGVTEGAYP